MSSSERQGTGRLHYAWVVFATTFLVLVFSSSVRGVFSLLIQPLMDEFGWDRGVTALPASVNILVFGLMGPFAAALMVRYGLRRVVMLGLVLTAVGSLLATQSTAPWHLVLSWGVVMGVGGGCLASVLASTVAATWFVERRGMVSGMLMAASTAGQLLFIPVNRHLVSTYSWRASSVLIAIATLSGIPLVAAFVRNRPEDLGLVAYGAPAGHATPHRPDRPLALAMQGLRDASSSGMFWILFGSFFVCGVTTSGMIQTHWFEAAADHGIAKPTAASLLVAIGVFDLCGSLASGWLTDRFDPRRLLFVYYGLRGLSLLAFEDVLSRGAHSPVLLVVIAFYGLDWVATVPPTMALANQLFGRERGSVVFGWLFAAHQLGGAMAAWLAAVSRDWSGSFRLAYTVGGVLCLVAAVASLRIGRADDTPATGVPAPVPA